MSEGLLFSFLVYTRCLVIIPARKSRKYGILDRSCPPASQNFNSCYMISPGKSGARKGPKLARKERTSLYELSRWVPVVKDIMEVCAATISQK